jgi:hypothetical protein
MYPTHTPLRNVRGLVTEATSIADLDASQGCTISEKLDGCSNRFGRTGEENKSLPIPEIET